MAIRLRSSNLIVAVTGGAVLAASAGADFLGLVAVDDPFALDGVTPLSELDGYGGERVINVYAAFDEPFNQILGVVGTSEFPFSVATQGGSGFVNHEFAADTPPPLPFAQIIHPINFDSFYTVGLLATMSGQFPEETDILAIPGTPGPNSDPWPPAGDPVAEDMGWFVQNCFNPGNVQTLVDIITGWGPCPAPCPPCTGDLTGDCQVGVDDLTAWLGLNVDDCDFVFQTTAGNFPDFQVPIMRLVVAPDEVVTGSFGVLIWTGQAEPVTVAASFVAGGSCCLGDGACVSMVSPATCAGLGGVYLGNGSTCGPDVCPEPGACCLGDAGGCAEQFEADCLAAGGSFQGEGSDCDSSCLGGCCLSDGSCQDTPGSACASMGGVFLGQGTICGAVTCEDGGACCLPDGACMPMFAGDCASMGGVFQGDGAVCAPEICSGACCHAGGCIENMSRTDCESICGGQWNGPDSLCGAPPCPPPEPPCPADVNGDGAVNVDDLVELVLAWGECG